MLIGFVPMVLLIYLAIDLYEEKKHQLHLVKLYQSRIEQSADISTLIGHLQEERKASFDFAMTKAKYDEITRVRPLTDSKLDKLSASTDPSLAKFPGYTNLDRLASVRAGIDSGTIPANAVMHFYSNTIFRLNTLNTLPTTTTPSLNRIHQDIISQKILTELTTYLGIIRSNIYNVLYTKKYAVETLVGTVGTYDVYKSYFREMDVKASGTIRDSFQRILSNTEFSTTNNYIDTVFKRLSFDSSFSAEEWWDYSFEAVLQLRRLNASIWNKANAELTQIYKNEKRELNTTLILLILTLTVAVALTSFVIYSISRSLRNLGDAAKKLSSGVTDLNIRPESDDVVGELARCIAAIDRNNKKLADAAEAIGRGDFHVPVKPRSERDVLGNAIAEMQKKLDRYKNKMESLVELRTRELRRSNEDLQQFAHIASHDLKEPVRKIRTFSSRLVGETEKISDKGKAYIDKIQSASERMTGIIDGILSFSMVNAYEETYEAVDLEEIMDGIRADLEVLITQKSAKVLCTDLPVVQGIPVLMHQLFYNLVSNALKFTPPERTPLITVTGSVPEGAEIAELKLSRDVNYTKIQVADNGIGFSQEQETKMFDLFTRLNSRDKFEGTGLGLALCKKIVERHNGHIYATGREGAGSVFTILLPARK